MRQFLFASFVFVAMSSSALASGWALVKEGAEFRHLDNKEQFLQVVTQGKLKRFGITLEVKPDGKITGNAFGFKISGAWDWRDGYFCRNLNWGGSDIGTNCQEVKINGRTLRFTSDQGTGDFADLRLR